MKSWKTPENSTWPSPEQLMRRIRSACLTRGWDLQRLAREAGISRTTLYLLQQGNVRRPRISTLTRIAEALSVSVHHLLRADELLPPRGGVSAETSRSREFDRLTNHAIQAVFRDQPHLFTDWDEAQWDELYSTFGTGGELTPDGVVAEAGRINAVRETQIKLSVVLETHLREVAVQMIESLYRMVAPESNLAPSSQLTALIQQHLQETQPPRERHPPDAVP